MAEQDQNQTDNNQALSVVEDYDRIHAAVVETKRGRWFLEEFAKKNRHVESKILLKSLEKIEAKLDNKSSSTAPISDEQYHAIRSDLELIYKNFKLNLIAHLKWAGVEGDLALNKTDTIIRFAKDQFIRLLENQKDKLNEIIVDAMADEARDAIIVKLNMLHKEIGKIFELQQNLFTLLDDYMQFAIKAEHLIHQKEIKVNIDQSIEKLNGKAVEEERAKAEEDLKRFHQIKQDQENQIDQLNDQIARQEATQNDLKDKVSDQELVIENLTAELEALKSEKQDEEEVLVLEQSDISSETEMAEAADTTVSEKLGRAARIKKIFKIEETMRAQQAQINQEVEAESTDFDAAFKDSKLEIIDDQPAVIDAPLLEDEAKPAEVATETILEAKQKQLNSISKIMNEDLNVAVEPEVAVQEEITAEEIAEEHDDAELILEKSYNPLNALAMLSKNERKLLYTYHH